MVGTPNAACAATPRRIQKRIKRSQLVGVLMPAIKPTIAAPHREATQSKMDILNILGPRSLSMVVHSIWGWLVFKMEAL